MSSTESEGQTPSTPNPRPNSELAIGQEMPERRGQVRFYPDPMVPVFFAHPSAPVPTAGLLADVSASGVRIVAPPTARPELHWGDVFRIIVSYSESARLARIEGMRLWAHVVRLEVNSCEFRINAAFSRSGGDGDWARLEAWMTKLAKEPWSGKNYKQLLHEAASPT